MVEKKHIAIISILFGIAFVLYSTYALQTVKPKLPFIPNDKLLYSSTDYGINAVDTETNQTIIRKAFDGHIEVYTTSEYQDFKAKAGGSISIPLYFKFISSSKPSTIIIIDPNSETALNCYVSLGPNKGSIRVNDYIDYNPKGTIVLKNDTIVQITMTIKIPNGLWPYDRPRLIPFNLYGIDNTDPIELMFRGEIDV